MLTRLQTAGPFLAFLILCGVFVWQVKAASERLIDPADYQRRLNITAANVFSPADANNSDDSLKIYAVNVVHTPPFKSPFIAYGIYLGEGTVVTAAHVVGRYPFFSNPRVLVAGEDLPATVIKEGSPEQTDLALLSVDQERLPISLRLRRDSAVQKAVAGWRRRHRRISGANSSLSSDFSAAHRPSASYEIQYPDQ